MLVDNGRFETTPPVAYFNRGVDGTGSPSINDPTFVVLFQHDDVTGIHGEAQYGSVKVRQYLEGCTTEIVPESAQGSAIGEFVLDPSDDFTAAHTGQEEDVVSTLENAVQTSIRYPIAFLDSNPLITKDVFGVITTKFCVRLSLLNANGDEFGFREIDVTLTHTKDETATIPFNDVPEVLGDLSVRSSFCDSSSQSDVPAPGASGSAALAQGEAISICLAPQKQGADTNEVSIVEVEKCVFWMDTNGNGRMDEAEEVSETAVVNGVAVGSVASALTCADGGCVMTATLPATFFTVDEAATVQSRCVVSLQQQGRRSLAPTETVVSIVADGELATSASFVVEGADSASAPGPNGNDRESGDAGCAADGCNIPLFCWIFRLFFCLFAGML